MKPDNFLFESDASTAHLKATDFGLAIRHWPEEPKLTSRSGTPAYMAPELVMQQYDEKCDIWSVGMVAYQLLTGRLPFWEDVRKESLTDVWKAILTHDINWGAPELKGLSSNAVDFLKALLQRDPALRPSGHDALHMPWMIESSPLSPDGNQEGILDGTVVQRLQRWSTFGHLKQLVLRMIINDILVDQKERGSDSLLAKLQDLFDRLDEDHSGLLTMDEISSGLSNLGYFLSEAEVEQLIRKVDADKDGGVNLREFLASLLDWERITHSANWQKYVEHAFSILDDNQDGFLSLEELISHLPVSDSRSDEERLAEARQMLREADKNNDGKISQFEFHELLANPLHDHDSLSDYPSRFKQELV